METIWIIAGVGAAAAIGYVLAKPSMPAITIPAVEMPDIAGAISAGVTPFKEFATKSVETIKGTTTEALETVKQTVEPITAAIATMGETISGALETVKETSKTFADTISENVSGAFDYAKAAADAAAKMAADAAKAAADAAQEVVKIDLDWLRDSMGTVVGSLKKIGEDWYEWTGSAWQKVKDTVGKYADIPQKITTAGVGIVGAAAGFKIGAALGTGIVPGLGTVIGGALGALVGWLFWE